MTQILPRSAWTSIPNQRGGRPITGALTGMTLHWPADGGRLLSLSQARVAAMLESWRRYHVNGNGWLDIGYNYAVDGSGRIWDLTGITQGAHAGTNRGNATSVGVLLVVGMGEQPSAAMIQGVRSLRAFLLTRNRNATRVYGHRDWLNTSCPGDPAYALIKSGTFTHAPTPAPAPPESEEDEMKRIGIWINRNGSYSYAIIDTLSGFVKEIHNGRFAVEQSRLNQWAAAWNIPGWVEHQAATYDDWIDEARKIAKAA